MLWNYDLTPARTGSRIWALTSKNDVIETRFIPPRGRDGNRWLNMGSKDEPIAWQPFVKPEPPFEPMTDAELAAVLEALVPVCDDAGSGA